MTKNKFIGKVVSELIDDEFSIYLIQKRKINKCGGWFDCYKRELRVAYKNDYGFEILIHEYCHFLQWKNDNNFFMKKYSGCDTIFNWLKGVDYTDSKLKKAFQDVIELEWDCERRSLQLIKNLKLPVDENLYIKTSNAYLLFYHIVKSERKWSKKSPYNNEKIVKLVPDQHFDLDFYLDAGNISKELREEYLKTI